jgi:hypothetical protein
MNRYTHKHTCIHACRHGQIHMHIHTSVRDVASAHTWYMQTCCAQDCVYVHIHVVRAHMMHVRLCVHDTHAHTHIYQRSCFCDALTTVMHSRLWCTHDCAALMTVLHSRLCCTHDCAALTIVLHSRLWCPHDCDALTTSKVRCGMMQCDAVWCGVCVLRCVAMCCGVMRCGVIRCGVVWCGAVWCGVLRCTHSTWGSLRCDSVCVSSGVCV